jgi:hypothetical protein
MRRRRFRTWAKWACTVALVLVVLGATVERIGAYIWSFSPFACYLLPIPAAAAFILWGMELDMASKRSPASPRGTCFHCGYDRRSLAADAKCPECGTVPARG